MTTTLHRDSGRLILCSLLVAGVFGTSVAAAQDTVVVTAETGLPDADGNPFSGRSVVITAELSSQSTETQTAETYSIGDQTGHTDEAEGSATLQGAVLGAGYNPTGTPVASIEGDFEFSYVTRHIGPSGTVTNERSFSGTERILFYDPDSYELIGSSVESEGMYALLSPLQGRAFGSCPGGDSLRPDGTCEIRMEPILVTISWTISDSDSESDATPTAPTVDGADNRVLGSASVDCDELIAEIERLGASAALDLYDSGDGALADSMRECFERSQIEAIAAGSQTVDVAKGSESRLISLLLALVGVFALAGVLLAWLRRPR